MQQQISLLLPLTFQGTEEIVKETTQKLLLLEELDDFIPSLYSICFDNEEHFKIRNSAILYLQNIINKKWNFINDNIKNDILNTFPLNLLKINNEILPQISHFSRILINNSFLSNNWLLLINEIFNFLNNKNTILQGLILSKSLLGYFKSCPEELKEISINFTIQFLNFCINFLNSTNSLYYISIIYHCLYRILIGINFQVFENHYIIIFLNFLNLIENYSNLNDFSLFLYKSLKFLTIYLSRFNQTFLIDDLIYLYNLIKTLFNFKLDSKQYCFLLKCLYEIVINSNSLTFLINDSIELYNNILFPFFLLSEEDFLNLIEQPQYFISENHKNSNEFNDPKEIASMIVYQLSKQSDESAKILLSITNDSFINYSNSNLNLENQILLFSISHIFSCVSVLMDTVNMTLFLNFLKLIFPLTQSDDILARASVFLILSNAKHSYVPLEFTLICIEHIFDSSPVVQYYSSLAAANFLDKISDDETINLISNKFSNDITSIFSAFIELSTIFENSEFSNTLAQLIKFFSKDILPLSNLLGIELLNLLLKTSNNETFSDFIQHISTFSNLIELVLTNKETLNEFLPLMISNMIEILKQITNPEAIDLLLETFLLLIEPLEIFKEQYWEIASIISPHFSIDLDVSISSPIEILMYLLKKDNDFHNRLEISPIIIDFVIHQLTIRIERFDSWNEISKLAAGLLFHLPNNSNLLNIHYETFTNLCLYQIEHIDSFFNILGLISFINGLLYHNFDLFIQKLNNNNNIYLILDFWCNNMIFPESIITFLTILIFLY